MIETFCLSLIEVKTIILFILSLMCIIILLFDKFFMVVKR